MGYPALLHFFHIIPLAEVIPMRFNVMEPRIKITLRWQSTHPFALAITTIGPLQLKGRRRCEFQRSHNKYESQCIYAR
jgi:hypothetical protein